MDAVEAIKQLKAGTTIRDRRDGPVDPFDLRSVTGGRRNRGSGGHYTSPMRSEGTGMQVPVFSISVAGNVASHHTVGGV